MLLVGAGLLLRTLSALRGVDIGIKPEHILTMTVPVAGEQYKDPVVRHRFYAEVLDGVSTLPGVVSAGFTTGVPLAFKGWFDGFAREGEQMNEAGSSVMYRVITPDYLRTLGIPLVAGRNLAASDTLDRPRVALVNETLARRYWPGEGVIGKHFRHGGADQVVTVVGVVADVHQAGIDVPPQPEISLPIDQERSLPQWLAVRTANDPKLLVGAIRNAISALDPEQPIANVRTMEEVVETELFSRKTQTTLLLAFAAVAVLLAAIGVYGVLAYFVTRRTGEIGIRIALGAKPSDIQRTVLRHCAGVLGAGVALGLAGAWLLTGWMRHMLFGVTPRDPLTFVAVPVLLVAIGLLAGLLPARRASRVDPLKALREASLQG